MKTIKNIKYVYLLAIALGFMACNDEEDFVDAPESEVVLPALTDGSADFSTFVSVGASFTAGFTDNGLFIAGQESSFPNTLAKQFSKIGGGTFTQPLMNDNFGGLILNGSPLINPITNERLFSERLVFGGAGPVPLQSVNSAAISTTDFALNNPTGPFNNVGVPGAKSFHMVAPGYGNLGNFPSANPYAIRLTGATPNASMLELAVAQQPTFFTLSEIGGNDVLGYALSGGTGINQIGNLDASTYGPEDITDPTLFGGVLTNIVNAMTSSGAKGAIGNIPNITSLSHFTTVPHNPLDPSNPDFGGQIPTLNSIFGNLNLIYEAIGQPERSIVFSDSQANAVVIKDEDLADVSATIIGALNANPNFPLFVQSFGLPAAAAPLVANLLGTTYGQTRQATTNDLLVLPSSSVIGTVNADSVAALMAQGLPLNLAGQFSAEGITLPLADKWVLTPEEQQDIATATMAYNVTIASIVDADTTNSLALVDLNSILDEAATMGIQFDSYDLNTSLVTGGLVSLDGVHLTARGYALMANSFLDAIDTTFGSNFRASGNVAKADDFTVTFSPLLP